MNYNGQIYDVLTKMLNKQEQMVVALNEMKGEIVEMNGEIGNLTRGEKRQEEILMNILEVLSDDVPKFDELVEMEKVQGNKVILHKHEALRKTH